MTTPNTYKNGGRAVANALGAICGIIKAFGPKLEQFITNLATAGKITTADRDTALAFLSSANALCAIFQAIASNQGA